MTDAASAIGGASGRAVIARLNQVAKERGRAIARQWGEPLGSDRLSREQMANLWNLAGPAMQTPEGQAQIAQMVAQGQHAQAVDMAYPYRLKLIGKGAPRTLIERAQQLADLAARADGSALPPTEPVPAEVPAP